MWTLGLNREESWFRTSASNCWCLSTLRIFMIRTIAAWINSFLSSSKCRCVASCSCFSSAFIGMLMLTRNFLLKLSNFIKCYKLRYFAEKVQDKNKADKIKTSGYELNNMINRSLLFVSNKKRQLRWLLQFVFVIVRRQQFRFQQNLCHLKETTNKLI